MVQLKYSLLIHIESNVINTYYITLSYYLCVCKQTLSQNSWPSSVRLCRCSVVQLLSCNELGLYHYGLGLVIINMRNLKRAYLYGNDEMKIKINIGFDF